MDLSRILTVFVFGFIIFIFDVTEAQPSVRVEQGFLRGYNIPFVDAYLGINKLMNAYEGIPYAEPPVRFEYPVKKTPWSSTLDATSVGPTCYQESASVEGLDVGEDCLYLNVYVPPGITDAAVMVYLHGGAFREGSGSYGGPVGNGGVLSAFGDVIVASVNYRLGIFGFLTTGDEAIPGNYGMLDQVEALRWIRTNIHVFGGNKDNITIFGGAASSIHYHILSSQTQGLFQQAIMQSGTALTTYAFQDTDIGKYAAFAIGEVLGCTSHNTNALRECLRGANTKDLYDAGAQIDWFSPAPCIDNFFLDDHPTNLISRQEFQRIPLMVGSNAEEGSVYVLFKYLWAIWTQDPPFISREDVESFTRGGNPLLENLFYHQYFNWSIEDQGGLNYFPGYVDYITDEQYTCPADIVVRAHAIAGDAVYRYQMTHKPSVSVFSTEYYNPIWLGAGHAEEIPYVFGFPFGGIPNRRENTEPERALSVQFMRFWAEFAKTGTPSLSDDPENELYWPQFTIPELEYKVLDFDLPTKRALRADYCHFINDVVPMVSTFTAELSDVEREWKNSFNNWKYQALAKWQVAFNAYQDATRANCDANGCK